MHSTELETQQLINSLNTALVMVDNKLTIVYTSTLVKLCLRLD